MPGGTGPSAERGTRLHSAMATLVTDGEDAKVDATEDELRTILLPALREFDDLCEQYDIDRVLVEYRVHPDLPEELRSFGTVDVIGIGPGHLLVVDWKFGYYGVEVEDNRQLHYYAYGALTDPRLADLFTADMIAVTAIMQPTRTPMAAVAEVTREDIALSAETWRTNYEQRDKSAPVNGSWCRWCKAKPVCSAHQPEAVKEETARSDDTVLETLKLVPFSLDADSATLGKSLTQWQGIQTWVKSRTDALEQLLYTKAESGEEVPGWKLIAKRGSRAWLEPEKVERVLRRTLGVDGACPRKLLSPPQAEKALGDRFSSVRKYITTVSTGVKLVPKSSKQEAVYVHGRAMDMGKQIKERA